MYSIKDLYIEVKEGYCIDKYGVVYHKDKPLRVIDDKVEVCTENLGIKEISVRELCKNFSIVYEYKNGLDFNRMHHKLALSSTKVRDVFRVDYKNVKEVLKGYEIRTVSQKKYYMKEVVEKILDYRNKIEDCFIESDIESNNKVENQFKAIELAKLDYSYEDLPTKIKKTVSKKEYEKYLDRFCKDRRKDFNDFINIFQDR